MVIEPQFEQMILGINFLKNVLNGQTKETRPFLCWLVDYVESHKGEFYAKYKRDRYDYMLGER